MDIAVDIFAVCRPGAVAVSGILYWANRTVIGTISVGVFRRALSGELEECRCDPGSCSRGESSKESVC